MAAAEFRVFGSLDLLVAFTHADIVSKPGAVAAKFLDFGLVQYEYSCAWRTIFLFSASSRVYATPRVPQACQSVARTGFWFLEDLSRCHRNELMHETFPRAAWEKGQ